MVENRIDKGQILDFFSIGIWSVNDPKFLM